ncbi:MAG: hypothetical protein KOO66_13200 [Bacteroidales bacterium]|nr:hypothetical protein [Bacteroidales bacterium]
MSYKVKYIKKKNYLIRKISGKLNFSNVMDSWQYLVENDLKGKKYKGIINDFSDTDLVMNFEKLEQLLKFFKLNNELFESLKIAVIMTNPDNIVFPVFAKKISSFNIKAFSTLEGAEKWMLTK